MKALRDFLRHAKEVGGIEKALKGMDLYERLTIQDQAWLIVKLTVHGKRPLNEVELLKEEIKKKYGKDFGKLEIRLWDDFQRVPNIWIGAQHKNGTLIMCSDGRSVSDAVSKFRGLMRSDDESKELNDRWIK